MLITQRTKINDNDLNRFLSSGMRHGFGVRQSASYGSVLGMTTLKPNFLSGLSSMDRGSTQSLDADGRAVNSMYRRDMNAVVRGGFVLVGRPSGLDKNGKMSRRRNSVIEKSNAAPRSGIFRGLLKKQKSTGDIDMTNMHGATISRASHQPPSGIHSVTSSTDSISLSGHMRFGGSNALLSKQFGQDFDGQSNASFIIDHEQIDPTVTETYMGKAVYSKFERQTPQTKFPSQKFFQNPNRRMER